MLIDPKKVQFETQNDVIDYITKGFLPPRKEHFDKVIDKVRTPDNVDYAYQQRGKEVVISENVISENDRKLIDSILTKVYENRIRNRNKLLIGIGSAFALMTGLSIRNKRKAQRELENWKKGQNPEIIKGESGEDIEVYRF